MSAAQTAPPTKYRAPVYTNVISFACRCSVCGADLRHGDFAKIYPQEMAEPLPSHVIRKDTGQPNMIRYMTRVIGVTRHDDKGNPIECHPDPRQAPAPALQPSAVTPATPQPDIQALVTQAVQNALAAQATASLAVPMPNPAPMNASIPQRVPWPGGPVDGRNNVTKTFLAQYPSVSLQELKEQAPSGWITI